LFYAKFAAMIKWRFKNLVNKCVQSPPTSVTGTELCNAVFNYFSSSSCAIRSTTSHPSYGLLWL